VKTPPLEPSLEKQNRNHQEMHHKFEQLAAGLKPPGFLTTEEREAREEDTTFAMRDLFPLLLRPLTFQTKTDILIYYNIV
jgi:hypothetical protein